jgi:phage baseplate assembly protein W
MQRHDYAYPFRINAASAQPAQTSYADHVEQMIRQVLLTSPGERADLPEFGCGLRQLLFAPHSEALDATTQILVLQALQRWLAGQIQVRQVTVVPPGGGPDDSQILIQITYVLLETMASSSMEVRVI